MQRTSCVKAKPVRFWVIFMSQACMSQQSQHWRALELIPGKHRFIFSKYKLETKSIIFDAKKKAQKNPLKVKKVSGYCGFSSFPVQATCETLFRALYLVLGIWPDDIHILELVEWGKRIVWGFFLRKVCQERVVSASACIHEAGEVT